MNHFNLNFLVYNTRKRRQPKPSTYKKEPWIYVENPKATDYDEKKVGKWLVWMRETDVDRIWEIILEEVKTNRLGISAKVATAYPSVYGTDKRVICIYTYDFGDKADVDRVRQRLRELGFVAKIPYKTDAATLSGKYGPGSSLYYE